MFGVCRASDIAIRAFVDNFLGSNGIQGYSSTTVSSFGFRILLRRVIILQRLEKVSWGLL